MQWCLERVPALVTLLHVVHRMQCVLVTAVRMFFFVFFFVFFLSFSPGITAGHGSLVSACACSKSCSILHANTEPRTCQDIGINECCTDKEGRYIILCVVSI